MYLLKRIHRTELVVHAPLEDFLHQRTRRNVHHGKIAVQVPMYLLKRIHRTAPVFHVKTVRFLTSPMQKTAYHGKIALEARVLRQRELTHPIERVRYARLVGIQNLTFVPTVQTASTAKKAGKIYAHQENMVSPTLASVTAFRPTVLVNHARLGNIVPLKTRPW